MDRQHPVIPPTQRLTRRDAVRAGGLGAAAFVGGARMEQASAQDATPTEEPPKEEKPRDLIKKGLRDLLKKPTEE